VNLASKTKGADAIALCRTLDPNPDPLRLYAALSEQGQRPDTMLFEQMEGPSFILESAALRGECRGANVRLTALSANGQILLKLLADRMAERIANRESAKPGELILQFPAIASSDAAERLEAPSPFDVLRELTIGLTKANPDEPYGVLALAVIAYDHVDFFEHLPAAKSDPLDFPDQLFWIAESLIIFEENAPPRAIATAFEAGDGEAGDKAYFDAGRRLASLVERCSLADRTEIRALVPAQRATVSSDLDDQAYCVLVEKMKAHVAAGDVYQIVASRSFTLPCPDPLSAFAALRRLDRSPYGFFVSMGSRVIFGASPETSVRIEAGAEPLVEVRPIAGTRARGMTQDEDNRLEAELRLDHKEQAEHMMLVDLARNDVARVSRTGSRRVGSLMNVERYARVMHLVSSVSGTLKTGYDFTHAMKSCLNMGTLTGAPKIRAMQLLREAEGTKRGPYGGTIGWVSGAGAMDSAIVIRSAVVQDGIATVRAGAGIVHDSIPRAEADETRRKASALLSVLAGASIS
jgi:anthranilate synthase component 1